MPLKVVFDCNIFLQALSRPNGPSGRCLDLAFKKRIELFVSPDLIDELREVCTKTKLAMKMKFSLWQADEFINAVLRIASVMDEVEHFFNVQRDPDDSHYINLAIAAGASLVVSRDLDLLDLMHDDNGKALRLIAPELRIITPPQMLILMDDVM